MDAFLLLYVGFILLNTNNAAIIDSNSRIMRSARVRYLSDGGEPSARTGFGPRYRTGPAGYTDAGGRHGVLPGNGRPSAPARPVRSARPERRERPKRLRERYRSRRRRRRCRWLLTRLNAQTPGHTLRAYHTHARTQNAWCDLRADR